MYTKLIGFPEGTIDVRSAAAAAAARTAAFTTKVDDQDIYLRSSRVFSTAAHGFSYFSHHRSFLPALAAG